MPASDPLRGLLGTDWQKDHWFASREERDLALLDMGKRDVLVVFDIRRYQPSLLRLAEASREHYGQQLTEAGFGAITTEIRADVPFHFAEPYHQQYLAKPGSRPYCSAQPTGVRLGPFPGSDYRLPTEVWTAYDWTVPHCVLRGDNAPIPLS